MDWFFNRVSENSVHEFESLQLVLNKIKRAFLLVFDDFSEIQFPVLVGQTYLRLNFDLFRSSDADLVVTRHQRYNKFHHLLPVSPVVFKDPSECVKSINMLGLYLNVPILKISLFKSWSEFTHDWDVCFGFEDIHKQISSIDKSVILKAIFDRLNLVSSIKKTPFSNNAPVVVSEGLPHMCSEMLNVNLLTEVLSKYESYLIIGPDSSAPFIRNYLSEKNGFLVLLMNIVVQAIRSWILKLSYKRVFGVELTR